jgi:hypothetical protein
LAGARLDNLRAHREGLKKLLHQTERLAVLPSEVVTTRSQPNRIRKVLGDAELSIHYDTPDDPLYLVQRQSAEAAGKPILWIKPSEPAIEIARRVRAELLLLRRQRQLYVIYDPSTDGGHAGALTSYFSHAHDCKVLEPQPGEGYHRAKLDESDGILFFHQNAPESWLDRHREALLQGAALRARPKPEAWYFVRPGEAADLTVQRDPLRPQWTITRTGDLNLTDLRPFSEAFQSWGRANA